MLFMQKNLAVSTLLLVIFGGPGLDTARAQIRFRFDPGQRPLEVEAIAGEPFGVGRISFELPPEMLPQPLGIDGLGLSEADGRILYPTLDNPAGGKMMKEILNRDTPLTTGGPVREQVGGILREILDRPPRLTFYFLFRGDKPLNVTLDAREPIPVNIVPRRQPANGERLLQQWWNQYSKSSSLMEPKPDYPPIVDNYVMSTLGRRLNLRIPETQQTESAYAELRREVGFNLGTESLRTAMQQDRILGLNNLGQPADQPLPKARTLPALEFPESAVDVAVEPLAMHVPAECFYARFGRFANFLWLQDTLQKWGGDVQNLIAMRGLDRGMRDNMERQLVLKQTALSRLLGDTVVADVAIIGTDLFFREGASYGILFQARNKIILSASLMQQRKERLNAGGVTEEKIKIADRDVFYMASADGRVRSYYAVDGDFQLIASSKALVERFFATSSSKESLGGSAEFRHARSAMPLDRDDTIWLYVSDAFFQNLTSPQYRIEMARRLQAASDIQLVELAQLAAVAEDKPGKTIQDLLAASLLPPEFGPLPDGSHVVLEDSEAYDSVRGRRGSFLPVLDTPLDKVTQSEASEYERFVDFYQNNWGRMDPIIAALKRTPADINREHVVVDVLMSPFAPGHFESLNQRLGPADQQRLAPIAGDMATIELALRDQRVFGALRGVAGQPAVGVSSLLPMGRLRDLLVGYIGTTGDLGVLSVLNIGIPPTSDPAGYAQSRIGGWRRTYGPFTVFSFQREVLDEVVPQLRFEEAPRPAQIRLHVEDLSETRMMPRLNDLGYARTRTTSLSNLRLLHALQQQFHVAPSECKTVAERLLDAKLVCPLGGEYVFQNQSGDERSHWTSTSLESTEENGSADVHAPEGYIAPPLNWFRGLDLDATMTEKTISAHAELLMQMPEPKKTP